MAIHTHNRLMAICRKKKFTSPKKVGGPQIGWPTGAKKWVGYSPPGPIGSGFRMSVIFYVLIADRPMG